MRPAIARRLWSVGEPVHAVVYFSPVAADRWAAAGFRGFWRGYFATRAAPFGPVGPAVVTATFFNFDPRMVARALPAVWEMGTPADALRARLEAAVAALLDVLGTMAGEPTVAEAAGHVRRAIEGVPPDGRPLYGANAGLAWPEEPLEALWHGLTLVREHRGDGHNAALLAAGIDGCGAHVLGAAVGGAPRTVTQPARGWADDAWAAAAEDLGRRGLLEPDGTATPEGRALHDAVEASTDARALTPWLRLSPHEVDALVAVLARLSGRITAAGVIPTPNPMGLPLPPPD